MSALPPKADILNLLPKCLLMTQSGHLANEIITQHLGMMEKKSPAEAGPVEAMLAALFVPTVK